MLPVLVSIAAMGFMGTMTIPTNYPANPEQEVYKKPAKKRKNKAQKLARRRNRK